MALQASFSSGDYEPADEGRYICTLTNVIAEERPSYDDPNVLEPNFVWDFEANKETDDKNRPYKFRHFTKTDYGNEKAKLTLLVNGVFGRAFIKDQVAQIDFEKLIGKTVSLMVTVTPSGKNKVLSVKGVASKPIRFEDVQMDGADKKVTPPPADKKATSPPADSDDVQFDPFGD